MLPANAGSRGTRQMLARRSIQKIVNDCSTFLPPPKLENLVKRLDTSNRDALEAEWELIVLTALASIGRVEHEADLGGSSRLDVRFESVPLGRFVADIRTVSDEGYDRKNPVHEFSTELSRVSEILRSSGVQGGFYYRVNGVSASVRSGQYKTKLKLPFTFDFKPVIFHTPKFKAFLAAVRAEPSQDHTVDINNEEVSVSITFSARFAGVQYGSYLSFNQAHDVVHNVVWRALKEKSTQIKRAGLRATGELAGVILCDGGCGLLRALPNPHTLTLADVISRFLRKSSTVDFVCVLDIPDSAAYGQTRLPSIEARTWTKRDEGWVQRLSIAFNAALRTLPAPQLSPVNTLNHFKWAKNSRQLWGKHANSAMTDDSLEISLRAVMEYLAGRMERSAFERIVHPDWIAQLKNRLEQGRSVDDVSVKKGIGEDDDRLVIRFGEHDPAISHFRVPRPSKSGE
jgi:hypothetical protein